MPGLNLLASDVMSPPSLRCGMRSCEFWKCLEDWMRLSPPPVGASHIIQALLMGKRSYVRHCGKLFRLRVSNSSGFPDRIYPNEFSYPTDRMKRLYDINVHGCFFTAREAARHMIPLGGGSIILVASMSANVGVVRSHAFVSAAH